MSDKKRIKVSKEDLLIHLREQISFLCQSCKSYDQGNLFEGKRLAHSLRVLLHDKGMSKSLLGQLGLKSVRCFDTADKYDPDNLVGYAGLLTFKFRNPEGYRPWVAPKGERENPSMLTFSDWWNNTVIATPKKPKRICFCRRELVLNIAETDGGSHVDDSIEIEYAALSKWNAIGISTEQYGVVKPIENPILPCIRQIAHEVILLLFKKYPEYFEVEYTFNVPELPPGGGEKTGVATEANLIFRGL